jgi:hypothetical protein
MRSRAQSAAATPTFTMHRLAGLPDGIVDESRMRLILRFIPRAAADPAARIFSLRGGGPPARHVTAALQREGDRAGFLISQRHPEDPPVMLDQLSHYHRKDGVPRL